MIHETKQKDSRVRLADFRVNGWGPGYRVIVSRVCVIYRSEGIRVLKGFS